MSSPTSGFDFKPLVESLDEELEENFEHPGSATGAGPSNKGGKIDRSDIANKDTSKFGRGGSKGGGKPSAGGTNAAPKAGKMDRTDIANKATGRWLKEEEDRVREAVRRLKEHGFTTEQIKESLAGAYKKAQKR